MIDKVFIDAARGFPELCQPEDPRYVARFPGKEECVTMDRFARRFPQLHNFLSVLSGVDNDNSPTMATRSSINKVTGNIGIEYSPIEEIEVVDKARKIMLGETHANILIVDNTTEESAPNVTIYTNLRITDRASSALIEPVASNDVDLKRCGFDSRIVGVTDALAAMFVASISGQIMPRHHAFAQPANNNEDAPKNPGSGP